MSRNLSSGALRDLYDQETGEAFLLLVTIAHADLAAPIRVTSDGVDTLSRGDTFMAAAFEITLPDDTDDHGPRAAVRIANVDRTIVDSVRSLSTSPDFLIEIVRASDPDTVEADFPDFQLADVSYDALVVEGTLTLDEFLDEPFPAGRFDPARFPGLF